MKATLFLFLALLIFSSDAFAAKKDFKGLFGSYRREKFTENEVRGTDFGMDFLLSTLLPVSPFVKSIDGSRTNAPETLSYSTFFNLETTFFMTFSYHWEAFLSVGYYKYETRKENLLTKTDLPATPIFHQFDLTAYPAILGVKYRLSTDDIVPYIGIGAGFAYVQRKGSYDNDSSGTKVDQDNNNVLCGQISLGLEFYFTSRAGIRLETSAHYMGLPARTFDYTGTASGGGSIAQTPILIYQPNPWSVRYASGLFILF